MIRAPNLGADFYVLREADIREQLVFIRDIIRRVIDSRHHLSTKDSSEVIPVKVASEFIRELSHDVVGALHNITGYATLLENDFDRTYIQGITRLVAKLAERMRQAVSDMHSGTLIQK